MRVPFAAALAAILALAVAPIASADQMGPDWVSSDNVEYLGSIKDDFGLTTGAKVLDDRLYVTSGKNISIYDISTPETPQRLGSMAVNVAWENEEVPTNGKVLAFASDFYSATPSCLSAMRVTGCVQFYDVRDPANIKEVGSIPVANHTVECVLDCQYFYGRAGTIIDARGILEGRPPTVVGNWIQELRKQGVDSGSCHHMRELRPGVILTACQPFSVITVNPWLVKGASPTKPKVMYTGESDAFVHSARWPREGRDDFVLIGGETNFNGRCDQNITEPEKAAFRTYSAEKVKARESRSFEGPVDSIAPQPNGTYVDGSPPANHLGCSVHWFQEHKSFLNGGLVALSEYEQGVRFMQVKADGKIQEQGYFLPLGGSSSSPKWATKGNVVYSLDYDRGIDIIRWKGKLYVPPLKKFRGTQLSDRNRMAGTGGETGPLPPLTDELKARRLALAEKLRAEGWSPAYCRLIAEGKIEAPRTDLLGAAGLSTKLTALR